MEEAAWQYFIAYASGDRDFADGLYGLLFEMGRRVFLDHECLQPGDEWDIAIPRALRGSRVVVILVSSRAGKAHYQRDEIAAAINLARKEPDFHRVIPLYLEGAPRDPGDVPYGLSPFQLLDGRVLPLPAVAEALEAVLAQLPDPPKSVAPIAEPFRRLTSFSRRDDRLFFGRELEKRDLAELVDEDRLVVLHGMSGTGKSSLLEAGLRPLVERKYLWLSVTPKDDPVAQIASAAKAELSRMGHDGHDGNEGDAAERVLALARLERRPVLLVVDQLEEIFQRRTVEEARRLCEPLAATLSSLLSAGPAQGVAHVLLSVRDDYFGHLTELKQAGLARVFAKELLLRPLDASSARRAIAEPLALAGYAIGSDLVKTITQDLSSPSQEVRPVELQIVCDELFQAARKGNKSVIGRDLYNALGGAGKVLATYLRRSIDQIAEGARMAAERILKQLVGRQGARRPPATIAELAERTGLPTQSIEAALSQLSSLRLVEGAESGEGGAKVTRYRIAHDLIAREIFDKLSEDEKRDLALRERVRLHADDWIENRRRTPTQLSPEARRELIEFARRNASGLASHERQFLASVARWDRNARAMRRFGPVMLALFAIAGAGFSVRYYRESIAARARVALTQARLDLPEDPARSLAWIRESLRLGGGLDEDGWRLARDAWQAGAGWPLLQSSTPVTRLVFSPPGDCADCWNRRKRLIAVTSDVARGQVAFMDLDAGGPAVLRQTGGQAHAIVSSDGALVAVWEPGEALSIFDGAGRPIAQPKGLDPVSCAAFSPDGKSLFACSAGSGPGQLLGTSDWRPRPLAETAHTDVAAFLTRPPNQLLFARDESLAIIDVTTGSPTATLPLSASFRAELGQVTRLVPSPTGEPFIAITEADAGKHNLAAFNAAPAPRLPLGAHGDAFLVAGVDDVTAIPDPPVVWSPDGQFFLSGDDNGDVWVHLASDSDGGWHGGWAVAHHDAKVVSIDVSLDVSQQRRVVVSASGDGEVIASRIDESFQAKWQRRLKGGARGNTVAAVSPDGRWAATGGADGVVRLWSLPENGNDGNGNDKAHQTTLEWLDRRAPLVVREAHIDWKPFSGISGESFK